MQSYDLPRFPVLHADLYRLSEPRANSTELGFEDVPEDAVTLLEWPDRAGGQLPTDRLDVALHIVAGAGRDLPPRAHHRLRHLRRRAPNASRRIRGFLDDAGFRPATRRRIQGDASTRSYERLTRDGASYILMNSPRGRTGRRCATASPTARSRIWPRA